MKDKNKKTIISLYDEMYQMTKLECSSTCRIPHSCCSIEYCLIAISHAKERYGVDLETTVHPTLPLMGKDDCIAAPHFRPLCTLHTCEINSLGYKTGSLEWTEKYFNLRDNIEELEYIDWRNNNET